MNISVRTKCRSKKQEIVYHENLDLYDAHIKSPPVDGKANKEVIELIANFFQVSKKSVKIISGKTSRQKILNIQK